MAQRQDNPTKNLLEILKQSNQPNTLKEFIVQLDPASTDLPQYLMKTMAEKGLSKSEIVKRSGLYRTYAYQILQGSKQPSRDKLIALCIGMNMDLPEVQRALTIGKLGPLYPKEKRDAILIFAVNNAFTLMNTNELLDELGETVLE